jgi:hypothetical protein
MLVIQTIHNACNWYLMWLGFIHYGGDSEAALFVFEQLDTSMELVRIHGLELILTTLRLAIAGSIMVCGQQLLCCGFIDQETFVL